MLVNKETKKRVSLFGRILSYLEIRCKDLRMFVGKRDNTLEVMFLMTYVILQLGLVLLISNLVVSVFVLLLLFFLSLERIAMHLKVQIERDKLTRKEKEITEKHNRMIDFYKGIKEERDKLLTLNESLLEHNKVLKRQLKKKR